MCKRIKYQIHTARDNCEISRKTYTSIRGAKYRIVLDYNEMKFYIRNERDKRFCYSSSISYKTNVTLKHAAKKKLIKLGIKLSRESRKRTFGICKKGMTQDKWEEIKKLS